MDASLYCVSIPAHKDRLMSRTLYVVDGFALIFRAYYAFINRPLMNSKGENTSAVFGFFRMVFKLIRDYSPQDFVIAMDAKGKTFRHEMYDAYKANRFKAPEDLLVQIPWIIDLIEKMGIPSVSVEGFEADDIMATLAYRCREKGYGCRIFSGDKDILQLLGDGVEVLTTPRGSQEIVSTSPEMVQEKFGVTPEQVADYLALVGDSSDNVPGVKGIGAKGAAKLLAEYGSISSIYKCLNEVKPDGVRKKLESGREDAELSLKLVTLDPMESLDFPEERWAFTRLNAEASAQRLVELELKSLLEDPLMQGDGIIPEPASNKAPGSLEAILVDTEEKLQEVKDLIGKADLFALDTETTSLDPMSAELLGVSLCFEAGKGYYIPIGHKEDFLPAPEVITMLRDLLGSTEALVVGQNLKYDLAVLRQQGIILSCDLFDTMVAGYLCDPGKRYKLEELAKRYLRREMIEYKTLVPDKEMTLLDVPVEEVALYAAEDAEVAFCLYRELVGVLEENGLVELSETLEMPLVPVLGRMEDHGIALDEEHFAQLSQELESRLDLVRSAVFEDAGEEFNLNSPKQLSAILFEKMGIPPVKKTKTGYSTNEEVLLELADTHQIAVHILEYRKLAKLKNTYVDVLPTLIHEKTGRIHTSFNQTIAATGRLSSSNPNLQNIPIREELGREVRRGFVAAEGSRLLSADYSQIELRVLAALSGDPELVRSYNDGADIHTRTAGAIFGIEEDAVSREQRAAAKTVNFGVIYGQSAFGLSKELKIGRAEAQGFIDAYFGLYSGVQDFFAGIVSKAEEDGFVRTHFGRIRPIPELLSKNKMTYGMGRRFAINTVIQGTAADLIKLAMLRLDAALIEKGLSSKLLLQVHDELVLEVPDAELEQMQSLVAEKMKEPWSFDVPVEVSIGIGSNWDEAH